MRSYLQGRQETFIIQPSLPSHLGKTDMTIVLTLFINVETNQLPIQTKETKNNGLTIDIMHQMDWIEMDGYKWYILGSAVTDGSRKTIQDDTVDNNLITERKVKKHTSRN